jgi:hypothetical protein
LSSTLQFGLFSPDLRFVYFLNGGVASITTIFTDGTTVEAAKIGDEGMLGRRGVSH